MKAVMIVCNMIINEEVQELLDKLNLRGFTQWNDVQGKGSDKGEPHMGTHIWPSLNSAFLVVTPEEKVKQLMDEVKELEKSASKQGIRAFVWNIEQVF